uniref:BZIP domain-containing protein n=1 Tax=Ascaris lumbricoides TaxID=6252 RepID=A0A0M3HKW5_ASCLU
MSNFQISIQVSRCRNSIQLYRRRRRRRNEEKRILVVKKRNQRIQRREVSQRILSTNDCNQKRDDHMKIYEL